MTELSTVQPIDTTERFTARIIEEISNGKGYWKSLLLGVFDGDTQIGTFTRNYNCHGEYLFAPFRQAQQWYALYSPDYTSTRLLELPSCKDIGGERSDSFGFCPVEYFVPTFTRHSFEMDGEISKFKCYSYEADGGEEPEGPVEYEPFAFVCGCIWGDDTSWKIQYIDLSQVSEGIITRSDRFGYIELAEGINLKDAVRLYTEKEESPYAVTFAVQKRFQWDGSVHD